MSGFYQRFATMADRFGDRPAIQLQRRDGVERFTYRDVERLAARSAAMLTGLGVAPRDRVAILAENDAHWIAFYLGVLRLGAVAVPLDTAYKPDQVARLLDDCSARAIATSPRFLETTTRAIAVLKTKCDGLLLHPPDGDAAPFPVLGNAEIEAGEIPPVHDDAGDAEQAAVILYTSGTTSDPKGVVLTHGNLLSEIEAVYEAVPIDERDVVLGVLPLFHALAQMANLMLPLGAGGSVVFLETVNTTELLRALSERGITAFCCVPQFFYLIHQRVMERVGKAGAAKRALFRSMLATAGFLRERLGINVGKRLFGQVHAVLGSEMRLLVTGGSRFDPRIGRDLYRMGFNILQAYGLTETSGGAAVLRANDPNIGSVGHPLPGVEIEIRPSSAVEDSGAATTTESGARVGEIAIRGPVVSPGYYKRPDANEAAFRDGWLMTGDLGYLDGNGRLYVTGRAKEIIVTASGKNLYPEEIETHYQQSPFIKELCVLGISNPDEPAAERLHAIVVPDFEVLRERKIVNSREVVRFDIEGLSARLPGYKRILSYDLVTEDLPRTTTRKLKRFEIARKYLAAARPGEAAGADETLAAVGAEDEAWLDDPDVGRAVAIVRKAAQRPGSVRADANLELDLGLDSMERVELLAELEATFGVRVEETVAQKLYTVRELVDAVRSAESGAPREESSASWAELLTDPPEDRPALDRILAPHPVFNTIALAVMKTILGLARLGLGVRIQGRENLPRQGPMLISPNHQSFLDGFLLTAALPARLLRRVFFVGASEYFETPLRARVAGLLHIVPVDPDGNLLRAMRAGAYGLRNGNVLVLFPEGERSIDGRIKKFKKGAAILSANVGAPIVPVALEGLYEFWPRDRGPRWSHLIPFVGPGVTMRFGTPLVPESAPADRDADYDGLTDQLRAAVAEMMLPMEPS